MSEEWDVGEGGPPPLPRQSLAAGCCRSGVLDAECNGGGVGGVTGGGRSRGEVMQGAALDADVVQEAQDGGEVMQEALEEEVVRGLDDLNDQVVRGVTRKAHDFQEVVIGRRQFCRRHRRQGQVCLDYKCSFCGDYGHWRSACRLLHVRSGSAQPGAAAAASGRRGGGG